MTTWRGVGARSASDGDGWTTCTLGHRHWGPYGAAGLLVVSEGRVLLQHRAAWSHGGDTWGVPGGARHSTETAEQAARRETVEETALDLDGLEVLDQHVADHGSWTYTTFVALLPDARPVVPDRESLELRWVPVDRVTDLALHKAFSVAWPSLRVLLA